MNPIHPVDDSVNPQVLVDWLVEQHRCEWCGDTISTPVNANGDSYMPQAEWRCWEVKRGGYTSKHWKHICSTCNTKDRGGFGRRVFPIIKEIMPEHESLSAIMAVQPVNAPAGEIMYMDYIHGPPRGRPRDTAMYVHEGVDYHSDCKGAIKFPPTDWSKIDPQWRKLLGGPA